MSRSKFPNEVRGGALDYFALDELACAELREANAKYWSSCAEKTRRMANRHTDSATREHFMKAVGGYEALARAARGFRKCRSEQ